MRIQPRMQMRIRMRLCTLSLLPVMAAVLGGCAQPSPPAASSAATAPTLQGDSTHPGQTQGWVDTKLYFGLGPAG